MTIQEKPLRLCVSATEVYYPKAVLFDLDGTLVDSLPDIIASVRLTEKELGLAGCSDEQVCHWIGNGAKVLIRRVLTGDMDSIPSDDALEQTFAVFMRHYAEQGTQLTKLYDGAEHVLQTLRQQPSCSTGNVRIGLVTNKPKTITVELLDKLDIAHYFEVVLGDGDVANPKPHGEMLLTAAKQLGVDPKDCLMVGDSSNDIQAARNADMPVVGVRGGYNHGEAIEVSHPDWVIDKLTDLFTVLTHT